MKWHSTKLLPALLVVLSACGGVDPDGETNRIGGGFGSGTGGEGPEHCSGLMAGSHCSSAPPEIPIPGGDSEILPGEFLPANACNAALPDGAPPGLPMDMLPGKPGNGCVFLGLTCLVTNVCGAPGLTEGAGGVTMVPGPPPPPPEASVWVASWQDHVTKVGTTSPIAIRGRYLGALPSCGQPSFHMGFTGAIGGAAGRIDIQNWMLNGPDVSTTYPTPPAMFNMNWGMLMARHGNATYGANMLTIGDAANESSTSWLRVPSHFYAGFDTGFQFRASGSATAFTLGLTNDGLTARAVTPANGYQPDVSIKVNFAPATDTVQLRAYYDTILPAASNSPVANLADNTWRNMRVQFVVTNALTGAGTLKVWLNNVGDADAPVMTQAANLATLFSTGCDAGTGDSNPSRSTVDYNNDAWVANRAHTSGPYQATVTKIAGEPNTVKCSRKTGTANDLNGVVDSSSSGALYGGSGVNDECVLFTVPVGGNRNAGNVGAGVARALAMGANDVDSGPPGSVWVGNYSHTWLGSGQSVKLRNSDGAEMGYFDLGTNPYGVAVTGPGDARVWYTNGHGGPNIQFVDGLRHDLSLDSLQPVGGAVGSGFPRNNTLACQWNNCVSNVFTQPGSAGANATVKNGGWCRNQFYGVSVDEYNNVWNVTYSCGGVARFTPPGYKRLDTGTDTANPDASDATADTTFGHWDYYGGDSSTGVFVSKSQPTRRAWAFFGRTTVRMIDAITMSNVTTRYYTGTQAGHGGLGLDLTDNMWRVGDQTVSKFIPFGAHAIANGATYTNVPIEALGVGEGTYTYSDFTGYTAANITGRQVNLDRMFVSTCGDNAPKRWTRLSFTGSVPANTALEFRIITANSDTEAATKLNASIADAGPFYLTPTVKALGTGGPASTNDSGVWLAALTGGNPNEVSPSEILGVRVTFLSDNHTATPTLSGLTIEGVCDGLPVPPCLTDMPTCGAFCGTIQSCTVNVATKNRVSCGACPLCGNNVTTAPEACDDGNLITETACAYGVANCVKCNGACSAVLNLVGPRCGDGLVNGPLEVCDDGNTTTEAVCIYGQPTCIKCNAGCTAPLNLTGPYCGNSVIDAGEVCDDGNSADELVAPYGNTTGVTCDATCLGTLVVPMTGYCGDGAVNGPEVCDDRNNLGCGTCEANCLSTGIANARGSITTPAAGSLVEGEVFTVSDGVHAPVVFEFEKNSNGVRPGRVAVDVTGGINADTVRNRMITAINGVGLSTLNVVASIRGAGRLWVTSQYLGSFGDRGLITEGVGDGGFSFNDIGTSTAGSGGHDCANLTSCLSNEDCTSNSCSAGFCMATTCGDGIVGGAELCDDHNANICGTCTAAACNVAPTFASSAVGSFTAIPAAAGALPVGGRVVDTQTFVVTDFTTGSYTFEFNSVFGVTAGRIAVAILVGDTADQVATKMRDAINLAGGLNVTASCTGSPGACTAAVVTLVHDVPNAAGGMLAEASGMAAPALISNGSAANCGPGAGCNTDQDCFPQGGGCVGNVCQP